MEFLQSYVYLERLRADENLKIEFEVKGRNFDLKVAPLLYIAFIENAFKHRSRAKSDNPFIHITFDLEHEDRVGFTIENRLDPFREKSTGGGFGLPNVKKRLELLYPGRYELIITDSSSVYRVELIIFVA